MSNEQKERMSNLTSILNNAIVIRRNINVIKNLINDIVVTDLDKECIGSENEANNILEDVCNQQIETLRDITIIKGMLETLYDKNWRKV